MADYGTISRRCRVLFCHFGNPNDNHVLDETAVVGLRLLALRAENPPLSAKVKQLIEVGPRESIKVLVDAVKS
jgi:hypothetical protein